MIPQPDSLKRIGPRPLGLHLGLASATLGSALAALPAAQKSRISWLSEIREEANDLVRHMEDFDRQELLLKVGERGQHLVSEMLSGIRKYHEHPYRRDVTDPSPVWTKGTAELLDYSGGLTDTAPAVFIVPSLVNRSYILDLSEKRSLVRYLAANGIRPFLLNWGEPGEAEREYSLENYIIDILLPALEAVRDQAKAAPVHLMGYCMGGTLSVALAALRQEKLASLITLASPWDFKEGLSSPAAQFLHQDTVWKPMLENWGELPVDMLQALFASLDPNLCLKKFSLFNRMTMQSDRAQEFVALEDWLNDGVPLVKKVAEECFSDWYGKNKPVLGEWDVGGQRICPQNITIPLLIAVPKSDRIVPPKSALALADQVREAQVVYPPSGHIGMIAGGQAEVGLWSDIAAWIRPE